MTTDRRVRAIVLSAALMLLLNNALTYGGLFVFDPVLLADLGVTPTALKFRETVMYLAVAALAPFGGAIIDRWGVRAPIVAGLVLIAGGLAVYGQAQALWQLYAIHALFGVGLILSGLIAVVVLVSTLTDRHRGLALGVVLAASSLGNALLPPLTAAMLESLGWRASFPWLALMVAAVIPLMWFVVGGHAPAPRAAAPVADGATAALSAALRTRRFWQLGVAAGLTLFALTAVTSNLVLFGTRELGQSVAQAAGGLGLFFTAAMVAQLLGGAIADRVGAQRVQVVAILLFAAGLLWLGRGDAAWVMPALLLAGVGWGANYASLQLLSSSTFAGPAVACILMALLVLETLAGAAGPVVATRWAEVTGHFAGAFTLTGGLLLLAAALIATLPRVPAKISPISPLSTG
ncbi:MFS transporter [Sandaracinobacteroides saxicola]|uniref:MFS transporter n=1 Tax=Sandaracinobacteroides saxicola TaxID=2759707 RepID=A0A7G5IG12_9SPHN|nr:MFS transporter [Sandaracinobacteroides saxicola]QMW22304.1 MFS transporter [Sandaracinobacteroides saxicola]